MAKFRSVCRIDDLVDRQGQYFLIDGQPICVVRIGNHVFAVDDRCPHAGASLARGYLDGDVLRCRIHHWGFRLSDGECVDHKAPVLGARCFATRVIDGFVEVLMDA